MDSSHNPALTTKDIQVLQYPHSLQVDPTTAHIEPLTGPCPRGLIVSTEDESDVPEGFLAAITSQTNSNIFVPAVMLGPLNTMRTMPGIAHNPILRSISYIAGIADVSALLCAVVLRARMYYLKRRDRSEHFAEDFYALRRLRYGDTALCLHSPTVLIFGVMFLFASELVGLVMTLSTPQYRDQEQMTWSAAETGAFWAAVGACSMYLAGTICTALCLGRKRYAVQRIALPVPVSEKV